MPFRPWIVGVFVTAALILFTALTFLIGDRQKVFSRHITYRTEFIDLSGIASGAKVRVAGVDAGKVKTIDFPDTASQKFRVELEVDSKLRGMVHRDSVVSIETEGVVGDKFVLIKRGGAQSEPAQPGDTLPSKEAVDFTAIIERASAMLNDAHATINDLRGRLDTALDSVTTTIRHADVLITDLRPTINRVARDATQITGKVDGLITDITDGKGSVGLFFKDEETRRQLVATVANFREISRNLNDVSLHANQVMTDFQSRDLIAKTDVTLQNVQAVSQQLNTTIKEALDKDDLGENGAANLRQTLSNLNRTSANLADDTEALKHNFFLRGFFKKRGFYNLDQIAPADYLQAIEHTKSPGVRKWLPAADVFLLGPDGKDQFTPAGLNRINNEMESEGDRLPGHLLVVEGYSPTGTLGQQAAVSRNRADLVRRYLEQHFHLRHSDIGIVALGSSLPKGTAHDNWDGAAILILDAKSTQ